MGWRLTKLTLQAVFKGFKFNQALNATS